MTDQRGFLELPPELTEEIDTLKNSLQMNSRTEVVEYLYNMATGSAEERPETVSPLTNSPSKCVAVYCMICESLLGEVVLKEYVKTPVTGPYDQLRFSCVNCSIERNEIQYRYGDQLLAVPSDVGFDTEVGVESMIEYWSERIETLDSRGDSSHYGLYRRILDVLKAQEMIWFPDFSPLISSDIDETQDLVVEWMNLHESLSIREANSEFSQSGVSIVISGSEETFDELLAELRKENSVDVSRSGEGWTVNILA